MDNLSCNICFEIFDGENHLPKSLKCGHPMCLMCLNKMLVEEPQSLCPFCCEEIEKDGVFPTNFALLTLKNEHLTLKDALKELTSFKEKFPEEFLKFSEDKAVVAEKQKSVDSFVEVCDEYIITFDEINDDIGPLSKKLELNKAIEKNNEVAEKLNILKSPLRMLHKLSDCENHKEFILQLCEKARSGPVFAVHAFEKKDIFGIVRFDGTKCYIHSMSLEEIDRRSNATLVPFQDLKLCWMKTKFGAFLEISTIGGATVRPEIELSNSELFNNFLILCTGEVGSSYKGVVTCNDKGILNVPGYISNGRLSTGPISLIPPESKGKMTSQANNYFVFGYVDGSFHIIQTNYFCATTLIGTFRNVPNFERLISFEPEAPKILDCGLVFDLGQLY